MMDRMPKSRLNKYIASCGICSRRKADELITSGRIRVNGEIVFKLSTVIDTEKDSILFDGDKLKPTR